MAAQRIHGNGTTNFSGIYGPLTQTQPSQGALFLKKEVDIIMAAGKQDSWIKIAISPKYLVTCSQM